MSKKSTPPRGRQKADTARTDEKRESILRAAEGLFAEQGFHVVMQNVRGVFGSGGEFNPMFNEEADGLDTIAWIERPEGV